MRALITGASGFCGRHLANLLRAKGLEVHTLGPRVTSEQHHLSDPLSLESIVKALEVARPDYVFHLAGVASATDSTVYYHINTVYAAGLLQGLELSGQAACPVLLVGTSAEYGMVKGTELPITEETLARPYNHYGISKLAQTQLGLSLANAGRPIIITRPFNIIGPGMPEHLSIQTFARQITESRKGLRPPRLEVGNLTSSRDFLDVWEVVKIYWRLIQTPRAYGQLVNICSGQAVVIGDILSRLIALAGIELEVYTDPLRFKPVDVPVHYGCPDKLIALLGYRPELDLEASLSSILEDLNARL